MRILQTNQFKKTYKKLLPSRLKDINEALEAVIADPEIGEQKKGDLDWLRVYKFKANNRLTLLGYNLNQETQELTLTFVALGSHENFYRDLKR